MGQKHDAEVVWRAPVEAGALHQHDLGLLQQLQEKLLVVLDRIHRRIEAGEHVQRGARLHAGNARDGSDQLIRQIALLAQATAFAHQVVDALVTAQRSLDGPLPRHVGAQAHVRQHVQTVDVVLGRFLVAGDDQPASAVAARAVAFRQRVEGEREHVFTERAQRGVLGTVVQHLVVHLVRKHHQAMLTCDGQNASQQFF